MRILFFTDHFFPEVSAPAAHIFERAKLWVAAGHQVTVITAAPNFPTGRVFGGYKNSLRTIEDIDGIRVVRVKTFVAENKGTVKRMIDFVSYAPSAIVASLLEVRHDVIISSSPHLFVPVAGVACSMLRRVPHVFEIRDLWPAFLGATTKLGHGRLYRVLEWLELFLYGRSRRIIAFTTSFISDLTNRGVPDEKIDLVIVGANLELFAPRQPDSGLRAQLGLEGRFVVGYLGTMGLAHGLGNVVAAAQKLRDSDIAFLFVGEGAEKDELQKMVLDRDLQNIVFVSRQPKEQMPRYWSICDASLVHLKNDPLFATVIPSKLFESMAAGVPILYVGPDGEASQIVQDTSAGICVSADDPDAFAKVLLELKSDSGRLETLRFNSRAAAPEYSRQKQAERTLKSLERALIDEFQ